MKISLLKKAVAATSALTLAFTLSACSSTEEDEIISSDQGLTGTVAATVNGVEIPEDKVTRAINNYRMNYGYEDQQEWHDYFETYNTTVECFRYDVLGQLIDRELVLQCADELDISTNDDEITEYVEKMSSQYSSEEKWQEAVKDAGWDDEQAYRDALEYSIIQKKIKEKMQGEQEAIFDDAALLEAEQNYSASYDGAKKSAHIVFGADDEELANEVLAKINSGELTFEEAAKEYSTDEDTKDNGGALDWNVLIEDIDTDYSTALSELENAGDMSGVVEVGNNYEIIEVTDVWTAPEEITSTSQMPDEFAAKIRTDAIESNTDEAYDQWVIDKHPENDVVVNPMPENMPYYVDLSDVYSQEELDELNEAGLEKLINGVVSEEEEVTDAEAVTDDADALDAAVEGDGSEPAGDADASGEGAVDASDASEASSSEGSQSGNDASSTNAG